MIIRQMEERDIEQVYQIEKESFAQPWTYKDFVEAIDNANILYLKLYIVAEEAGVILGYCGLWGIAGEGQINNVAVKKEYRGKQIGFQMLHTLIQLGLDNDLYAFTLEVRVSNLSAIQLYHNLGFEDVGIRKDFYDYPKENAIIMWLKYN